MRLELVLGLQKALFTCHKAWHAILVIRTPSASKLAQGVGGSREGEEQVGEQGREEGRMRLGRGQ